MAKFADQSQVGEWMRAFVAWIIARAKPDRLLLAGRTEVFFDNTQIEISSDKFQGAKLNYNDDIALSWQCLWVGPMLADADLGSAGEMSAELPAMLSQSRELRTDKPAPSNAPPPTTARASTRATAGCGTGPKAKNPLLIIGD